MTNRRNFLAFTAASLGGIHVAYGQATSNQPRLVVVMLRGAMDGLSLVAPYAEPAYYQERPIVAIPKPGEADGLLSLTNQFGVNPGFASLMPYWQNKQMLFIHASGSPDATRSHFDAQDYMESATPGRKSTPDGWMNRLATVLSPESSPASQRLRALNLGPTMPRIFAGDAAVASLPNGNAAVRKGYLDKPELAQAFARLYSGDDRLSMTVREATATRGEIMGSLASDDPKADAGALPLNNGLVSDTGRLGQLMARDARVRLAFVPVGGWDTHANQGGGRGQLTNRFTVLAQSLDALAKGLGERLQETTILVMSEFGRTVRQNGTNGTDHGHGNVAFVLGGGVNGGRIAGQWPGLDASARYEGRDLAITTDFRDIIADVLEQRFRLGDAQLARVLPGMEKRARVGLYA